MPCAWRTDFSYQPSREDGVCRCVAPLPNLACGAGRRDINDRGYWNLDHLVQYQRDKDGSLTPVFATEHVRIRLEPERQVLSLSR
jgi:hypothetical protein